MGIIVVFIFLVGLALSLIILRFTSIESKKPFQAFYVRCMIIIAVVICILCYYNSSNLEGGGGEPVWNRVMFSAFFMSSSLGIGSIISSIWVSIKKRIDDKL